MAVLTLGTKTTSSLKTLVWQPSGMSAADLATLMALIKNPEESATAVAMKKSWIQNGRLFIPGQRDALGVKINPGDYIAVDPDTGWPFIIPSQGFSTNWQHS